MLQDYDVVCRVRQGKAEAAELMSRRNDKIRGNVMINLCKDANDNIACILMLMISMSFNSVIKAERKTHVTSERKDK